MNMPATIRAEAHASAIQSVTRLYHGSTEDIANELLQNARRAGATAVEICFDEESQTISFEDNGHGVANPAALLRLGSSEWNGDVASEDCAGMGFFSAAGLEVEVFSSGIDPETGEKFAWGATIGADDWTGKNEIPVQIYPHAAATMTPGTRIGIMLADNARFAFLKAAPTTCLDELRRRLERCTTFYPLPVTFNDKPMKCQVDMLADCEAVFEFDAYRVGVTTSRAGLREPRINFHGLTIEAKLPGLAEVGRTDWLCKVDVKDARHLQLVLPARKEVVQSAGWTQLKQDCLASIYRTIAKLAADPENPRPHSLSFENWLHSAVHGVDLPEAEAKLILWAPTDANGDQQISSMKPVTGEGDVLICSDEASESFALAAALTRTPERFPFKAFRPQPAYRGYKWYDRLPAFRIAAIEATLDDGSRPVDIAEINHEKSAPDETEEALAEKILDGDKLVASINVLLHDTTGQEPEVLLPAPGFIANEDQDFDSSVILLARDHGFTPASFACFAANSAFSVSDSAEADSFHTQLDRFQEYATERFLAITADNDALLRYKIEEALDGVRWSVPEGTSITVTITREADKGATISFDAPTRHVELSTAHLTQEVSDILDTLQDTAENRERPGPAHDDWRDTVVVCPYRYGMWVRRFLNAEAQDDMPDCLKACFAHADAQGATWILFDRDVEPRDDLPAYDW